MGVSDAGILETDEFTNIHIQDNAVRYFRSQGYFRNWICAVSLVIRSMIFNAAFYAATVGYLIVALLSPRHAVPYVAKSWARLNLWLLEVTCGITVEWHGMEKIPHGPLIVAAKHQSLWETFALIPLFEDPTFIVKRDLMWIPLFGWYMRKADMIPINRERES